ncbi:hypothetical protein HYPSUDRAFT_85502 [Hypholoma sublateritium FD-334 SS-4]|uniref:Uncharacterized protein n=1 Tax=Hypholoma sublateritium (strain FD-334 SS-4) TaxID=945553 RepID=A0A0D2Q1G4_HYPSF|nr:hypothetical protein HYPSUDRAFT_85502 [Hypholoma sublateritium FD-334 SS-4]
MLRPRGERRARYPTDGRTAHARHPTAKQREALRGSATACRGSVHIGEEVGTPGHPSSNTPYLAATSQVYAPARSCAPGTISPPMRGRHTPAPDPPNHFQTQWRAPQTIHLPISPACVAERACARKFDIWTSADRSADAQTSHISPNLHILSAACSLTTLAPRRAAFTLWNDPTIRTRGAATRAARCRRMTSFSTLSALAM